MNGWLTRWEPTWLFFGIYGEILITLLGTVVSTVYIAKRIAQKKGGRPKKRDEFESLTVGEGR